MNASNLQTLHKFQVLVIRELEKKRVFTFPDSEVQTNKVKCGWNEYWVPTEHVFYSQIFIKYYKGERPREWVEEVSILDLDQQN